MSPAAEQAYQAVMALPYPDRVDVHEALVLAEPTPQEVAANMHPDWAAEIARRSAAIDAGVVTLVPWEEVRAKSLARIAAAEARG